MCAKTQKIPWEDPRQGRYEIQFYCLNCGHEFTEDFPKGVEVIPNNWGKGCSFLLEGNICWVRCSKCLCNSVRKRVK